MKIDVMCNGDKKTVIYSLFWFFWQLGRKIKKIYMQCTADTRDSRSSSHITRLTPQEGAVFLMWPPPWPFANIFPKPCRCPGCYHISSLPSLPAQLPRISESEVTLGDWSTESGGQGSDPRKLLALIDPLDQVLGLTTSIQGDLWFRNPRQLSRYGFLSWGFPPVLPENHREWFRQIKWLLYFQCSIQLQLRTLIVVNPFE